MKSYRILVTLLTSLYFSGCAYAATTNLTATGTIATTCSFANVSAGVLSVASGFPNKISTGGSFGGTSISVDVEYLGTPTHTINKITAWDSAPAAAGNINTAFDVVAYSPALGQMSANGAGNLEGTYSSGTDDTIVVDMTATMAANVPMGTYSLSTVATCQ